MTNYKLPHQLLLIGFFLLSSNFISLSAENEMPNFQISLQEKFKTGINISYYENYWISNEELLNDFPKVMAKLVLAHQLGFSTVRLPVAFDNFLNPGTRVVSTKLMNQLEKIHAFTSSKQINLIIVDFYGKINKHHDLSIDEDHHAHIWGQVIDKFFGKNYDYLFFDLYNDPILSVDLWDSVKNNLMKILRPLDLNRYWIISSTNYCAVDALSNMKIVPNDNKIIYSFHFFAPYCFTHQGAPWDSAKTSLTGLPYPYSLKSMPPKPKESLDTNLNYNYDHYHKKANSKFIDENIRFAYDWMIKNQVPVICTEIGSINTISQQSRENYFNDALDVLRSYSIPSLIWDLDQSFGIIDKQQQPIPAVSNWIKSFQ